jgi:hypothetical protein
LRERASRREDGTARTPLEASSAQDRSAPDTEGASRGREGDSRHEEDTPSTPEGKLVVVVDYEG